MNPTVGSGLPVVAALLFAGCTRAAVQPTTPILESKVAQTCEGLQAGREADGEAFEKVFVETVDVATDDEPSEVAASIRDHPVSVRKLAGILLTNEHPADLPWTLCAEPECASSYEGTLTLRAHLPKRANEPVRIEARLSPAEGVGAVREAHVETREQEPAVLEFSGRSNPASRIVVTPYLIAGAEDMKALLTCKEKRARAEGGQPSTFGAVSSE